MRDLPLRAVDLYFITSILSAGEVNLAVVLGFQIRDVTETREELTVIESINVDRLRGVLRVLLVVSSELPRKGLR